MDFNKKNDVFSIFGTVSIMLPFLLIATTILTSTISLTLLGIFGIDSIVAEVPMYGSVVLWALCVLFTISGIVIGIVSLKKAKRAISCIVSSSISTILLLLEAWFVYYAGSHF